MFIAGMVVVAGRTLWTWTRLIRVISAGEKVRRDELMLVHEYQADLAVIEGGHEPREYQMLLIKKAGDAAVGRTFRALGC